MILLSRCNGVLTGCWTGQGLMAAQRGLPIVNQYPRPFLPHTPEYKHGYNAESPMAQTSVENSEPVNGISPRFARIFQHIVLTHERPFAGSSTVYGLLFMAREFLGSRFLFVTPWGIQTLYVEE